MTREEAIEILKKISLFGTHKNVQEKQRAICLAISALEQVTKVQELLEYGYLSCVHHDFRAWKFMKDLEKIVGKSERVKTELKVELNEIKPCEDAVSRQAVLECLSKYTNAAYHIQHLPSVTDRQTGEWICVDDYHIGKFKCSVCQTEGFPNTAMYKPTWNFCPNCGCRMVEPQESEEV